MEKLIDQKQEYQDSKFSDVLNVNHEKYKKNQNKIVDDELNQYNIESLEIDVIFRRKFGKRLCFVNGLKSDKTTIEIKIQEQYIIQKVKIGDKVKIDGYLKFDYLKNKFLFHCLKLDILLKCPKDFNIFGTRLKTSSEDKNNEKAMCKFFRKNKECIIQNCIFRHYLLENEDQKLHKLKENQEKMYQESHEGDTVDDKDKKSKSKRNKLFAEFLVKTYTLDYLRTGPILDVAGGKGILNLFIFNYDIL